ncbi:MULTISPECIES: LysR family transcriptional regulator [unclassified Bradyrhizobium]|uniref:LysR family transcriptional regulator n=1 Tax=unclassified Bradyrhizobium TaxID=2631580 RepID=UPI00247AD2FE|nr:MULTISPECIES: LysR family transcriptional regulator [unclassified Bradyrhizobium]WGS18370.1 LysR family transcriptional regulator [Bradyrhizobium sp. ISRA463]WGS25189.1 LysR family transcriptional regulator [Bradyrhizobium sp. ISRA464]
MAANSSIDPIDIGTLRTLVLVYDLQSFSAAAKRLDVNQSTISYAIERLRGVLRDPLFVRQGNGVSATERCASLVAWARDMIGEMEGLAVPAEFDPAVAQGTMTISCNYHERQTLIPQFCARLRASAPQARLVLLDAAGHGNVHLKQNQCDIVLGPVGIVGGSFYRRHILTDHYVCVMDPDNPLARGRVALSAYARAQHVFVTHSGEWQPLYLDVLKAKDIALEPAVTLPNHDSLERIIAGTRLVATIPYHLARAMRGGLHVAALPFRVPISIDMYWSARTAKSGLHKWARGLLAEVAKGYAA